MVVGTLPTSMRAAAVVGGLGNFEVSELELALGAAKHSGHVFLCLVTAVASAPLRLHLGP